MFEETDLISGAGSTAINGLTFNLTSNILSIESDAEYGDADTDGGDWDLQMDLQQKQMHLWSETMHIQQQGVIFTHQMAETLVIINILSMQQMLLQPQTTVQY